MRFGDLSENAEYIETKKKLTENAIRSSKLNSILRRAQVADDDIKTQKDYVDMKKNHHYLKIKYL